MSQQVTVSGGRDPLALVLSARDPLALVLSARDPLALTVRVLPPLPAPSAVYDGVSGGLLYDEPTGADITWRAAS